MRRIIDDIKKEKEAQRAAAVAAATAAPTVVVVPTQPPPVIEQKKEVLVKKEPPKENKVLEKIHNDPKTIYVKNMYTDHYVLDNNVTIVTRHKDNTYTIYDEKEPRKFDANAPTTSELMNKALYYMPEDALKDMVTPRDGKATKTTVKKKEKEDEEAEKKKLKLELAQQGIFVVPNDSHLLQQQQNYPYPGYNPLQYYPPHTVPSPIKPSSPVGPPPAPLIHPQPSYPYPYPYHYPYPYPYSVSPGGTFYNPDGRILSPTKDPAKKLKPAIKNVKKSVSISTDQPEIHSYGDQETINQLMNQMSSLLANEQLNQQPLLPPIKSDPNKPLGWYEDPPAVANPPARNNSLGWYETSPSQSNNQIVTSPGQKMKNNQNNNQVQQMENGQNFNQQAQTNRNSVQMNQMPVYDNNQNRPAQNQNNSNLGWYENSSPTAQVNNQKRMSVQPTLEYRGSIQMNSVNGNNLNYNSPEPTKNKRMSADRRELANQDSRTSIVSSNSTKNYLQERRPTKFRQSLTTTTKRVSIQPQIVDEEENY